jgi:hypothetical protein
MTLKTAFRILIESEPIVVADEALILLVVNDETLLFSQLGKGINDDAEENVGPDDLDHDEEGDVVEQLDQVNLLGIFVVD